MRGHDREGRARVGAEGRATVEAEPADPEKTGSDHRQREVEGCEIIVAVAVALADHVSRNQPGDAGIEVNDGAAGKIESSPLGQENRRPIPSARSARRRRCSQPAANHTNAEKRMRSATEPATSATVMIANVI